MSSQRPLQQAADQQPLQKDLDFHCCNGAVQCTVRQQSPPSTCERALIRTQGSSTQVRLPSCRGAPSNSEGNHSISVPHCPETDRFTNPFPSLQAYVRVRTLRPAWKGRSPTAGLPLSRTECSMVLAIERHHTCSVGLW